MGPGRVVAPGQMFHRAPVPIIVPVAVLEADLLIRKQHPSSPHDGLLPQLGHTVAAAGHEHLSCRVPAHGPGVPVRVQQLGLGRDVVRERRREDRAWLAARGGRGRDRRLGAYRGAGTTGNGRCEARLGPRAVRDRGWRGGRLVVVRGGVSGGWMMCGAVGLVGGLVVGCGFQFVHPHSAVTAGGREEVESTHVERRPLHIPDQCWVGGETSCLVESCLLSGQRDRS